MAVRGRPLPPPLPPGMERCYCWRLDRPYEHTVAYCRGRTWKEQMARRQGEESS